MLFSIIPVLLIIISLSLVFFFSDKDEPNAKDYSFEPHIDEEEVKKDPELSEYTMEEVEEKILKVSNQITKLENNQHQSGQIIIDLSDQVGDKEKFLTDKQLTIKSQLASGSFLAEINSKTDQDLAATLSALNNDSLVKYAEPNYTYKTSYIPDDEFYQDQWAHYETKIESAWDIQQGNNSIVIAVIDTGVDYNHEDLAGNIWANVDEIAGNGVDDDANGYVDDIRGWDFVTNAEYCDSSEDCLTPDNNPSDVVGHGTHCAGIAGAVDNEVGIIGACPQCSIMPIRSGYMVSGGGGALDTSFIVNGIYYAVNNGAHILNMSFGGSYSIEIENALIYAKNHNVISIAAAGNYATDDIGYPASQDFVLAVAASTPYFERAGFSNFGPQVDIMAPGEYIVSTIPGNNYRYYNGTSMAAPYVAGIAGLILSEDKEQHGSLTLSELDVRNNLIINANKEVISDEYVGNGEVDAQKSLDFSYLDMNFDIAFTAPAIGSAASGLIDIIGTASSDNFSKYELFYGKGYYPSSYTSLGTFTSPVSAGLLFNDLDPILSGESKELTLKLSVTSSTAKTYELLTYFKTDNYQIVRPLSRSIHRAGSNVAIDVQINNGSLVVNEISYAVAGSGVFNTNGVTNNSGTNLSAILDTTGLATNFYEIKLDFDLNGQNFVEIIDEIHFDSDLAPGYPIQVKWNEVDHPDFNMNISRGLYATNKSIDEIHNVNKSTIEKFNTEFLAYYPGMTIPQIAELDGNTANGMEIVYVEAGNPPMLSVIHSKNAEPYFRKTLVGEVPGGNLVDPLVTDLDMDGDQEIIVTSMKIENEYSSYLMVYDHLGNLVWSKTYPFMLSSSITVADLDLDGKKEIIIVPDDTYYEYSQVRIFNYLGTQIRSWDVTQRSISAGGFKSSIALGNFDDDNNLEIVIAGVTSRASFYSETDECIIYVYNLDGTLVSGWPKVFSNVIFSPPVVGDLDHDGRDDILVGMSYMSYFYQPNKGGVYAYDRNGNMLPGWPFGLGKTFEYSSPVISNLDDDPELEVVLSEKINNSADTKLYILNHDATQLAGWSTKTLDVFDFNGPILVDIDNDGAQELIINYGSGFEPSISDHRGIYAWNLDGSVVNGFPKVINQKNDDYFYYGGYNPQSVGDFDYDGHLELFSTAGLPMDGSGNQYKHQEIYIWDLTTDASVKKYWPMYGSDPEKTFNSKYLQIKYSDQIAELKNDLMSRTSQPLYKMCTISINEKSCLSSCGNMQDYACTMNCIPGIEAIFGINSSSYKYLYYLGQEKYSFISQ